jgi:hypothetical protein
MARGDFDSIQLTPPIDGPSLHSYTDKPVQAHLVDAIPIKPEQKAQQN